jgi:hypothetical protein
MAMTLRLTDEERDALRERARQEGISMQEAARRAIRDYVVQGQHRDRVAAAGRRVMEARTRMLLIASGVEEAFEYVIPEDLLELAGLLLGDPAPVRDMGLLGAAAARPQTTVFGEDAYPDVWTKAAARCCRPS